MDAKSSEEEEVEMGRLYSSINYFQKKKPLSFEENKKGYLKRSSSMQDKPKKIPLTFSDSDSLKSDIENNDNGKNDITKNINIFREKMNIIKTNSIFNEYIYDDSEIDKIFSKKRLYKDKNMYQQDKIRRNKEMNINPLRSLNGRTRSFRIQQRYVPTILGFLEKNHSTNSLNSNGK